MQYGLLRAMLDILLLVLLSFMVENITDDTSCNMLKGRGQYLFQCIYISFSQRTYSYLICVNICIATNEYTNV